jgi:hypothetical protein
MDSGMRHESGEDATGTSDERLKARWVESVSTDAARSRRTVFLCVIRWRIVDFFRAGAFTNEHDASIPVARSANRSRFWKEGTGLASFGLSERILGRRFDSMRKGHETP